MIWYFNSSLHLLLAFNACFASDQCFLWHLLLTCKLKKNVGKIIYLMPKYQAATLQNDHDATI